MLGEKEKTVEVQFDIWAFVRGCVCMCVCVFTCIFHFLVVYENSLIRNRWPKSRELEFIILCCLWKKKIYIIFFFLPFFLGRRNLFGHVWRWVQEHDGKWGARRTRGQACPAKLRENSSNLGLFCSNGRDGWGKALKTVPFDPQQWNFRWHSLLLSWAES